mmetsp:Transcript_12020/g.18514  ORF Transcript_12020/g.18514 Transcript_12020/m.18514 type:complete len:88 (+) Transcript_12020:323-586(+)
MRWYASWMMLVMMGVDWQCYLIMWKVYECSALVVYFILDLRTYIRKKRLPPTLIQSIISMTPSMEDAVAVHRGATESNSESNCLFIQ